MKAEKRALLAIILSTLVILLYPYYLKLLKIKQYQTVSSKNDTVLKNDTVYDTVDTVRDTVDTVYDTVYDTVDTVHDTVDTVHDTVYDTVLENRIIRLRIDSKEGVIKNVFYREGEGYISLYSSPIGLFLPLKRMSFKREVYTQGELLLVSGDTRREYRLRNELLSIRVRGEKGIRFFFPAELKLPYKEMRYIRFVVKQFGQPTKSFKLGKLVKGGEPFDRVEWFSLSYRYYSLIFDPEGEVNIRLSPQRTKKGFILEIPIKKKDFSLKLYIGPNLSQLMAKYDKNWLSLLNYGLLSTMIKNILLRFNELFNNFGLAIILLSLTINAIFLPFTIKSLRNMKKMQKLQPEIQALRERYKNDPQTLNKELLLLYRKYNVNPMSGCLPLLFQIPIFIALYNTLMRSYELKNASFLWIRDLSAPDRLFVFDKGMPIVGGLEINILPILMVLFMVLQQRLSPSFKGTQGMSPWFFPILFGIIFYKFPAGLVLYWLVNSIMMFFLQWRKC